MVNLKDTKIYKLLKRAFFTAIHLLLKIIGSKNQRYYYSKWVIDNGDEMFLTKYPLNSSSMVIDVGGYTGCFSNKILEFYNPYLIIFEPVKKFHKILKKKYRKNTKIRLYKKGLSDKTSIEKIYIAGDGTSLIKKTGKYEKISLLDVADFIKKLKYIDLMSINIEGAEYEVLERLVETGLIKKIKFLQVQFHSFVPEASNRRKNIIKKIFKTHRIYFSYPFVWESFELKN